MVAPEHGPAPGDYHAGRLSARPASAVSASPAAGDHFPGAADGWSGVLFVPASASSAATVPLMVTLHGAGGRGPRMLHRWRETAERHGVAILAPDSVAPTWDVLRGGYGPDVQCIDRALSFAFTALAADKEHILIEGFSDGASYALSLGLANGDLFTHVLANSPGFCRPPSLAGKPRLLLTHGTGDQVLAIDFTSRMLAPRLQHAGYDVTYHEFEGGHSLLLETMQQSLRWAGVDAAHGAD